MPEASTGEQRVDRRDGACLLRYGGQDYREAESVLGCWRYHRDKLAVIMGSMRYVLISRGDRRSEKADCDALRRLTDGWVLKNLRQRNQVDVDS
jgi:hypothetical protein